jgi:hypothetical protein
MRPQRVRCASLVRASHQARGPHGSKRERQDLTAHGAGGPGACWLQNGVDRRPHGQRAACGGGRPPPGAPWHAGSGSGSGSGFAGLRSGSEYPPNVGWVENQPGSHKPLGAHTYCPRFLFVTAPPPTGLRPARGPVLFDAQRPGGERVRMFVGSQARRKRFNKLSRHRPCITKHAPKPFRGTLRTKISMWMLMNE